MYPHRYMSIHNVKYVAAYTISAEARVPPFKQRMLAGTFP